jgi:prepilin-type N-terminal cleavage/methylation domain-containing protein
MKASARKDRSPPFRGAFTLIELLMVVAILMILASLVLPVLARTRAKAESAQCLSNLRQWGMAYRQYADDNKDCLPRRGQGIQPLALIDRSEDWFNALPGYFGSRSYRQLFAAAQRFHAHTKSVFVFPGATDPGGLSR